MKPSLENAMGYGVWLHGEAVAAGTVMAAMLSESMGWMQAKEVKRIESIFEQAKLTQKPPVLGVEKYLNLMGLDKKVQDGKIRLVLQQGIGQAVITSDYDAAKLKLILENC